MKNQKRKYLFLSILNFIISTMCFQSAGRIRIFVRQHRDLLLSDGPRNVILMLLCCIMGILFITKAITYTKNRDDYQ